MYWVTFSKIKTYQRRRKMKKKTLLAVMISAAMVLTACGGSGQETTAEAPAEASSEAEETAAAETEAAPETPAAEPRVLTFASQSVGSGTYARVAGYCEVINKYLPEGWSVEISPISSGAQASVLLVETGQCDIGSGVNVTNALLMDGAYDEVETLENVGVVWAGDDVSYTCVIFSEEFQKKTGYTTLEELIESKTPFSLATKAPGSSGIQTATDLLSCLGSSFEDITANGGETYHIDPNQMCDMLKEGKADVIIDSPSLGQAALTELSLTTPLYFAQLEDSTLEKMAELGYPSKVMPGGSWTGQDEDMNTAVNCDSIVAHKDVPDEVTYAIAKAICEHTDEVVALVPSAAQFDPQKACDPLFAGAPLHPGAEKYYKEAGYLK